MARVTPENIADLERDEMFVFGSNELGVHGAGAAKLAYEKFGAFLGQGFGPSAQTFAIPTKSWEMNPLPLPIIKQYVDRFIAFTRRKMTDGWKFKVTRIGCGLAGYTPELIAPFFDSVRFQQNVWLPQEFIDIIDKQEATDNDVRNTMEYPDTSNQLI
jgi:hypothetical protein